MLRLCICDDDLRHIQYTKKLITRCALRTEFEIDCFNSAVDVLFQVKSNNYLPDIAILDIKLDEINGIELARQLNRYAPGCCIIFLTGYSEFCSDVYGTNHIFFVLKSRAAQYISIALEKSLDLIENRSSDFITVSSKGNTVLILPQKIMYIESSLRKLYIYTENGCYETYARLDDFLSENQSRFFIRCHQSYLVNLKYISGINSTHFVLEGGNTIPISRSRYLYSKEQFFKYL